MMPCPPPALAAPGGPNALKALARDWLDQGRPAMLVQVLHSQGSVPRDAGARMLVAADACVGTIGGGHLEWQAIAAARQALQAGRSALPDQNIALGPALGQCCGGRVRLRTVALDAGSLADWPDERPRGHLQLHGAGHVGQALVRLLTGLPLQVHWVDARDDAFALPGPLPSHVHCTSDDLPDAQVALAPPGACYLVMTHSHALDLQITQAVLRRGDFAYLGLIGSASKRARFEHRLAERGVAAPLLARLTCPVGVPGITGKAPEVVALAIAAQLLQVTTDASPAAMPPRATAPA
jgi:xanthine dehydrogenase accessory factor